MDSQTRKNNIRARLQRGDLKRLSEELEMSYSYLSQAFSPGSKFNFTDELARKVEQCMGWTSGALDTSEKTEIDSSRGILFEMAIKYRASLFEKAYPGKIIKTPYLINSGGIEKRVDIAIVNNDESVFAVGQQCRDKGYLSDKEAENLMLVMAMSGAKYGFLFAPSSGVDSTWQGDNRYFEEKRQSRWFKNTAGKIVEIDSGPDNVFEHVGI